MAGKQALRTQLTDKMGEPSFWDNQDKAKKTIQQLKTLNALVKPYEELATSIDDLSTMVELAAEDAGLEAELETELPKAESKFDAFEFRAMMSGPMDAANAFLRIQAGAGGTDACDWAQMLLRMYARWAEKHGFTIELQDELKNEEAGIQSATVRVSGDYAYGYLQGESGVHRLVRISPFGSGDTRQTSFAAVDVTPELDDSITIEIRDVRPAAGHVPLRRPRRPAPEQDRVGGPLHPHPDRRGRREPQRTQPGQEFRQRHGAL